MEQLAGNLAQQIINSGSLAILLALFAGILSSASPCTLAILPAAVAYVGGVSGTSRKQAAKSSLVFWLGLAISLTTLGLAAAQLGLFFAGFGGWWYLFLGAVFAVLGLNVLGVINLLPDNCNIPVRRFGMFGAFVAGAIGGVASSPCATPVLAAILALAAMKADWYYGALLLFSYSFGRGLLIFIAGFFTGTINSFLRSERGSALVAAMKYIFGIVLLAFSLFLFYYGF